MNIWTAKENVIRALNHRETRKFRLRAKVVFLENKLLSMIQLLSDVIDPIKNQFATRFDSLKDETMIKAVKVSYTTNQLYLDVIQRAFIMSIRISNFQMY